MKLLVVCPDYASHYYPLSAVAAAWQRAGGRSIFACGPGLASRVRADGFDHVELTLGPGSNPGLLRTEEQPRNEGEHLERFFAATRKGMAATLRYQAEARQRDLLWRPLEVADRLAGIVDRVRPRAVLSDQISFSATVGLRARNIQYAAFVTGHPTSVPGRGESYGYPHSHPPGFEASAAEMAELEEVCRRVNRAFTARFNRALTSINPASATVDDAFAVTSSRLTIFNYPAALDRPRRRLLPPTARFIGAAVRQEAGDPEVEDWGEKGGRAPRVYVSFGSFLSARADSLARVVEALRDRPWRVALALGVADREQVGELPEGWLARPHLPQVAILEHVDLVVTHGGNNTVTETLRAGAPMVVAPFSTDQFAGAEALSRAGLARVIDPNASSPSRIAETLDRVLREKGPRRRAARLGRRLRSREGPERAVELLLRAFPDDEAPRRR